MKVEKKNWILLGLVALLCFTGFLNYKFNENMGDSPQVAMQEPSASPQSDEAAQTGEQAQPTASQTGDAAPANASALTLSLIHI